MLDLEKYVLSLIPLTADGLVAHTCWSINLHPYLQVAFSMSSSKARYCISALSAFETLCMLFVGYYVRRRRVFKFVLLAAVPLYCLGLATFFFATTVGHAFGLFICSQMLIAIARSTFETVKELALIQNLWREGFSGDSRLPTLFAYISLSEKTGGMVGATLSDVLWARALRKPPTRYLNGQTILSAERVHPSLSEHLSYSDGSLERRAILYTYDTTLAISLMISIAVMGFAFLCLRGIWEPDNVEGQGTGESPDDIREIAPLFKQGRGKRIRDALNGPIHSQDMVDAYIFDRSEYKDILSMKPKGRRAAVAKTVTFTAPYADSDSLITALESLELRAELYQALKDEDYCQHMLETLQDETRRKQLVDALLSYDNRVPEAMCIHVSFLYSALPGINVHPRAPPDWRPGWESQKSQGPKGVLLS